ncbi:MAG: 16S rRNA (cytidine(1402)-2'-O)-methyltransferase [Proteobacteria bacterium]|nr:16S rRNA (cytidine(1402)-2'-O)-methyltransferase [Pseudomonadota bacterium]
MAPKGVLYIVATPIGNLDDITLRALNVLKSVDIIAAEDTRHTVKLLSRYSIKKHLFSFHDHNERDRMDILLSKIKEGNSVALVSDAGTPSVSDPGFRLVREAASQGLTIVPVPGVSAAVTALCASGLPTDAFVFLGFPPRKKGKRIEFLSDLKDEKKTLIFYESPHRIIQFIDEAIDILGPREAVLAREMTKIHEEFIRGSFEDIKGSLSRREQIRGECTLIVSGAQDCVVDVSMLDQEIRDKLLRGTPPPSVLAKDLSMKYPVKKRDIYEKILRIRDTLTG